MSRYFSIGILGITLSSCAPPPTSSGEVSSRDSSVLNWYLEKTATNTKSNALILEFDEDLEFDFSVEADGIDLSVPGGEYLPLQERVELSYDQEGAYSINLKLRDQDQTILVNEDMSWEYSLTPPPEPIVSFSELATADANTILLIGGSKGTKTSHIRVVGDVVSVDESTDEWVEIPATNQVPLEVTADDGLKSMQVTYRNVYGNESTTVSASIVKKSVGPQNCDVRIDSLVSVDFNSRISLSADNDGPLYFLVLGDVPDASVGSAYTEFEDATEANVELSEGYGEKEIRVLFKDQAENYCDETTFTVTVSEDAPENEVIVASEALWSNERVIELALTYAHLPGDNPEMYLSGNIVDGDGINEWIPFSESAEVTLNPVEGNRFIRAKFRRGEVTTQTYETEIFLKPYVYLQGVAATKTLLLSEINGLVSLTIDGCAETYDQITYAEGLACTPDEVEVEVTYNLSDGTSVVAVVDAS